jgi:hypothetical protein
LLFASLAVILIVNATPATWFPIFPPEDDSIKKLEIPPGFTVIDELAGPVIVPSDTVMEVVSDFFNVVVNDVDETPLAKLTLVVYDGDVSPAEGPV